MGKKSENLISIDELILRAKNFGVDFGKGNPKNRLRYFVKIGLLPHAERKTYNGLPSQGVYPESVLETLLEIDKKLKEGKSILQIKRELEKQSEKIIFEDSREIIFEKPAETLLKTFPSEKKFPIAEKKESLSTHLSFKKFFNFSFLSKIFFAILIFVIVFSFVKERKVFKKSFDNFLATTSRFFKIVQIENPTTSITQNQEIFSSFSLEPYLTINAETIINPKLKISQSIMSPVYIIESGEFLANISTSLLTADRTYTFPDQSGIVCLSTGNCFGLGGEVIAVGETINRLAKFIGPRRIGNSSINDLFTGTSITIDTLGNVGIGTFLPRTKLDVAGNLRTSGNLITDGRLGIGIENPLFSLHVLGRIQASGDICTDLAGGKCLSELIPALYRARGITGGGTIGYFPIWSGGATLANSILYQTGGKIGINLTNPNELLTLAGVLSLAKTLEPTTDIGFGKIFVGSDGKLYYKDENGNIFDLTTTGTITGSGGAGQIAFWSSTTTITGSDEIFWDEENQRLGIGTTTPSQKLEVFGTIKMTGFQLPTGAQPSYILTSDEFGFASWRPAPTGTVPSGVFGDTLRYNGLGWVADNFLYNTGSAIGIGTTSTIATLAVAGSGFFEGPLTIETTNLPQLILKYDNNHYLKFSVNSTSSEIFSSDALIFNSSTGELKFFDTSLKKGDKILRASIPIFKFPIASETSSTTFVALTREISTTTLNSTLPPQFEGSQRKFAILVNFTDNIPINASSSWRIDFLTQSDIDFEFQGQNSSNLDEGVIHLKDDITGLLADNWILKAKVPNQNYKLRVFNIFLLVYDQIQ